MKNTFKIILAFVVLGSLAFITPSSSNPKKITVVIDAGHGGKDNGQTFNAVTEKEIVEKITNQIKSQNTDQDIVIHLTRDRDKFVSLEDRIAYINKIKPDLVLSLHVNGVQHTDASGIEFFINKKNTTYEKSKAMAERLNEKMVQNHGLKSRGVKEAPLLVMEKSEVPAITVELGFLTNIKDRTYLTDEKEHYRMAKTILDFISEMK